MDQIIISERDQKKCIGDVIVDYLRIDIIHCSSNYNKYFWCPVDKSDLSRCILCSYYGSKYMFLVQQYETKYPIFYLCEYFCHNEISCDIFINLTNECFIQEIYFIEKHLLLTVEILNNGSYEIYINKIFKRNIKQKSSFTLIKIKKIHYFNNYPVITWIHLKKQNIINIDLNCMSAKYDIITNKCKIKYYKQIKRILLYSDIWIKCKK